jgi:hypothetical protein
VFEQMRGRRAVSLNLGPLLGLKKVANSHVRGGRCILITGPQGFERIVQFDADEQPAEVTRRVRETLDE